MKNRFSVVWFLTVLTVFPLSAQSFRGDVVRFVVIHPRSTASVEVFPGQVVVLSFDPGQPYVHGFEVEVVAAEAQDGSVAVNIVQLKEVPTVTGIADLEGPLLLSHPFADGRRQLVVTPTTAAGEPVRRTGLVVSAPIDRTRGAAAGVQIVPIMKGGRTPLAQRYTLEIRPLLAAEGGLRVEVSPPDNGVIPADLRIQLNGTIIVPDQITSLAPGIHRLSVQGSTIVPVARNVGIEAGILTSLNVQLERPMARVRFSVPSVAEAFLNGERVLGTTVMVEPGEHVVLIRLGDSTISRRLTLQGQRVYEIGLELDIFLKSD